MKCLVLLMLLIGCSNALTGKYKVGECGATNNDVTFEILDKSEDAYHVKYSAMKDHVLNVNGEQTFTTWISHQHLDRSTFKINCEE